MRADFHNSDLRTAMHLISEGEKSEEEKERQKAAVDAVAQYCRNGVVCRRVQVLNYFGQSFDAADCGKTCNNCEQDKSVVEEDLTHHAKDALNLVQSLLNGRDRVTQAYCVHVYRGSKQREVRERGHDKLPLYGVGKDLEKMKADRMFNDLVSMKALRLESVSNAQGWSNMYIQVSMALCSAAKVWGLNLYNSLRWAKLQMTFLRIVGGCW